MINLSPKEKKPLAIFLRKKELRSSEVRNELLNQGEEISLVTVKRVLSEMAKKGILKARGAGRASVYEISALGRIFAEVDAGKYISTEPDKRYGLHSYNFDLFPAFPKEIFSESELSMLNAATVWYKEKIKDLSPAIQQKELERLVIELSWKSSKIEGNTYTLLDTENLLLKNRRAVGKTKEEAQMILNHKDAFNFIYKNKDDFKALTKKNLEQLHHLLVKDMKVGMGLRKNPVGVFGSIYRPLDNIYQITEALEILSGVINRIENSCAKAFLAILGISYIQPFEDGNKRTSRLMADALLMASGLAPLSYRSIDENEYREATLVFYELNSIVPFKKIFIEQYDFAAKNYTVK